jgi:hypothetical protein
MKPYSSGRSFPRGQTRDPGARQRLLHEPPTESASAKAAFNKPDVQDPEDRHDVGYRNDSRGWTRGARGEPTGYNETATNYPGGNFDRGSAWRQPDKTIHGAPGDKGEFVKPGTEAEFEKRRK